MHTLRFLLNTTAYDEQMIDRRFHAISHIHNVMVKHAGKLLCRIQHDHAYCGMRDEYIILLKKEKLSPAESRRKTFLSREMNRIRSEIGLTEAGFQSYIKVCGRQYSKLLSSQQIQKEASRVYKGAEAVLFGNGRELHYKKFSSFRTISGKSNLNGAKFDRDTFTVSWLGLEMKCVMPRSAKRSSYISEALDADISYCEICRKEFPNGWHYYVTLYLKGDAPRKRACAGDGTMGIDPGTSTMAGYSHTKAVLRELAPRVPGYNRRIAALQESMDRSRRALNPDKYNSDGTIRRSDRTPWILSNTYRKNRHLLGSLYRRKSAYMKQSHEILCNELLADSKYFIVEKMSYAGLQKRSLKTERGDRITEVRKSDGTVTHVRKYKRRRRFGRSMNNRAPAEFLSILKRKSLMYGGGYSQISTGSFRASQYDHTTDEYTKVPLSRREKQIGGKYVQRDLYSAFLISNASADMKHADRDKCTCEFEHFLHLQDALISEMKHSQITMKQCFGF